MLCLAQSSSRYPSTSHMMKSQEYQRWCRQGAFELYLCLHLRSKCLHRYASGLLLITPLGDLVRRRGLILLLITLSSALTIGLPLTSSLHVFEGLSFLIGFTSVVPQIMMPFAADLAPPHKRASALSIVLSGLLLGILFARVLAGVVANFVIWRVVYWIALGLQIAIIVLLYFKLPDFPAKNKHMSYFGILYTMAKFAVTEPVLIQAALVNIASMSCFTNFWVRLLLPRQVQRGLT